VPGLDEAELRALLMAQPRMIGDARLARAAERALEKLMAALPVTLREQAASIRQRLYVDPTGWRGTRESLAMLPIVQDAVARNRKITIRYWRADREPVERTLDPLGLVAKGNAWYLVARGGDRLRTYRVSRIEDAKLLDRTVERPADFDLATYWRSSTKEFEDGWPRCEAVLRLEPQTAQWMKTWRSASIVDGPERVDPDGWITLRVRFDHPREACFIVLGLGPRVDVLEPADLRERVAAEAAAVVARLRAL
jgi:predicted DNA-binding transcriptional regulator YafY